MNFIAKQSVELSRVDILFNEPFDRFARLQSRLLINLLNGLVKSLLRFLALLSDRVGAAAGTHSGRAKYHDLCVVGVL